MTHLILPELSSSISCLGWYWGRTGQARWLASNRPMPGIKSSSDRLLPPTICRNRSSDWARSRPDFNFRPTLSGFIWDSWAIDSRSSSFSLRWSISSVSSGRRAVLSGSGCHWQYTATSLSMAQSRTPSRAQDTDMGSGGSPSAVCSSTLRKIIHFSSSITGCSPIDEDLRRSGRAEDDFFSFRDTLQASDISLDTVVSSMTLLATATVRM